MTTIESLIEHIKSRTKTHDSVFNAFKDIVFSEKTTTEIKSDPIPKSVFENTGDEVVEFYNRPLNPSDMFGGIAAGADYPVMSGYDINEIPNILGGKLNEKLKVTNIFTAENILSFNTLSSVAKITEVETKRLQLQTGAKKWESFKVGSYFPISYNVNTNLVQNKTKKLKINIPSNGSSKYSIIHLSPDRDCKYHHITIDAVLLTGEYGIPVIFIVLDTDKTVDGDSFEFKIDFINTVEYSNTQRWPTVMFIQGSGSDTSLPSISDSQLKIEGIVSKNNTVRINGIEYYYLYSQDLSTNMGDYIVGTVKNIPDRQFGYFVAATNFNQKHLDDIGIPWGDGWITPLERVTLSNYGVTNESSAVTYTNDNWYVYSESPLIPSLEATFPYTKADRDELFKSRSMVQTYNGTLQFTSGGCVSGSFGNISSDFKATYTSPPDFTIPSNYGQGDGQMVPSSTPFEYKKNDLPGPLTVSENGLFSAFDVSFTGIATQTIGLRYGHSETKLAVNIQIEIDKLHVGIEGVTAGDISQEIIVSLTSFRVLTGMIVQNEVPYFRCILMNGAATLYDSGLLEMDSDYIYGQSYAGFIGSLYAPEKIMTYWKPSFAVNIFEGNYDFGTFSEFDINTVSNAVLSIGALNGRHSLSMNELSDCFTVFTFTGTDYNNVYPNTGVPGTSLGAYGSPYPVVITPDQIQGFIAEVNSRSVSSYYKEVSQRTRINSFRVGFVCNKFKGEIYKLINSSTIPDNRLNKDNKVVDVPEKSLSKVDPTPYLNKDGNGKIVTDQVDSYVEQSVNYDKQKDPVFLSNNKISKVSAETAKVIDNVDGHFGWKLKTYYQLPYRE
jgi:hypothetical protein